MINAQNVKHLDMLKAMCVVGHFLSVVKPSNEQYSECAVNLLCKERHRKTGFMPVKECIMSVVH